MITVHFYRKHGGHVARLANDEAAAAVARGIAMYCPKHWYKAAEHLAADEAMSPAARAHAMAMVGLKAEGVL